MKIVGLGQLLLKTSKPIWFLCLFLFVIGNGFLISIYLGALYERIVNPSYKNLNNEEFIYFGAFLFGFVIVDILIIRMFIRKIRSRFKKSSN